MHALPRTAPAWTASLLGAALLFGACAPKKTVRKPLSEEEAAAAARARAAAEEALKLPSSAEVEEMRIRGKEFVVAPELKPARFEFDGVSLDEAARAALRANADYLKQHPDLEVLVEGHCDDRGTTEYNLALGQRRAKAVRDFYIRLGVPGGKLATLSFGEERPACPEATEECWAANRRADTKVRAQVSSTPGLRDALR